MMMDHIKVLRDLGIKRLSNEEFTTWQQITGRSELKLILQEILTFINWGHRINQEHVEKISDTVFATFIRKRILIIEAGKIVINALNTARENKEVIETALRNNLIPDISVDDINTLKPFWEHSRGNGIIDNDSFRTFYNALRTNLVYDQLLNIQVNEFLKIIPNNLPILELGAGLGIISKFLKYDLSRMIQIDINPFIKFEVIYSQFANHILRFKMSRTGEDLVLVANAKELDVIQNESIGGIIALNLQTVLPFSEFQKVVTENYKKLSKEGIFLLTNTLNSSKNVLANYLSTYHQTNNKYLFPIAARVQLGRYEYAHTTPYVETIIKEGYLGDMVDDLDESLTKLLIVSEEEMQNFKSFLENHRHFIASHADQFPNFNSSIGLKVLDILLNDTYENLMRYVLEDSMTQAHFEILFGFYAKRVSLNLKSMQPIRFEEIIHQQIIDFCSSQQIKTKIVRRTIEIPGTLLYDIIRTPILESIENTKVADFAIADDHYTTLQIVATLKHYLPNQKFIINMYRGTVLITSEDNRSAYTLSKLQPLIQSYSREDFEDVKVKLTIPSILISK